MVRGERSSPAPARSWNLKGSKPSRDGARRAKLAGSPRDHGNLKGSQPSRALAPGWQLRQQPPVRGRSPPTPTRSWEPMGTPLPTRLVPGGALGPSRPSDLRSGRISSSTKHHGEWREAEGGGLLNRYTGENLYRDSNLTLSAKTKVVTDSTQQPPAEDEAEFGSLRKRVAELELALSERKALEVSFRGFLQMAAWGCALRRLSQVAHRLADASRPSGCSTTSCGRM